MSNIASDHAMPASKRRLRPVAALMIGTVLAGFPPALATEGGPIRTGEHDGFSRIVMRIEPETEWSLETADHRATIFFPGKALEFGTGAVFERMPRARVLSVTAAITEPGTTIEVEIGCDCRISASFVGARYLALDVADRRADSDTRAGNGPEPEAQPDAAPENILMRQIETAASQGLIDLPESTAGAGPDPAAHLANAEIRQTPAPAPPATPRAFPAPVLPAPMKAEAGPAPGSNPQSRLENGIRARKVFHRMRAAMRMTRTSVPSQCLEDSVLGVGDWSGGRSWAEQSSRLRQELYARPDGPDPAVLAGLVKLHIHFGFGREAEALIAAGGLGIKDRPLLLDLARAVENRPVAAAGPLSLAAACPGRHGLWLAIGGASRIFHRTSHFRTVQAAFADLPPHLRALMGPALIDRLIDAGLSEPARLIYNTAVRPGTMLSPELRLSQARLVAVEGHPAEAVAAMSELVEENAHNFATALRWLTRHSLDARLPIPDRTISDLRAAARLHRGTALESRLRGLLAEALARNNRFKMAVTEINSAISDLPQANAELRAASVSILAQAVPEDVGEALYAKVLLAEIASIGHDPEHDPARRTIAQNLIDLGLPRAALEVLDPVTRRGDSLARQFTAEALLRLNRPDDALAVVGDMDGPQIAAFKARAHAKGGQYAEAVATLDSEGFGLSADGYTWPSSDWQRSGLATEDARRRAMAGYMAVRTGASEGPEPASEPELLEPEQAFQEPLPQLSRASLNSARRLLATSEQVEGFVQDLLAPE